MSLINTVPAHAASGSVKVWRVDGVESGFSPIPVRNVTIVPTLVAQRSLKGVDVIPMPCKEVCLERLSDV